MNKILTTLLIILLSTTASIARPLYSKTPVDNGSFQFPRQYAGTWIEQKVQYAQTYSVSYNPNTKGHIHLKTPFGPMIPAILSQVNDNIYMSIYDAGGKDQPEGYYIYRLVIFSDEEVKIIPLRNDVEVPKGQKLFDFLASNNDPEALEEDYAIWFSNTYKIKKRHLDTTGRSINITRKK